MSERPQVYRANNIERLELHRERYQNASKKDRARIAIEQGQAVHDVLIDLLEEMNALRKEMRELIKRSEGRG